VTPRQTRIPREAVDLGVPFRGGGLGAPLVTEDTLSGQLVLNFTGGGEFVRLDLDTAELLGRWELGGGCGEFSLVQAPDGCIYLPLWNGHVKRFDPAKSEIEDLGEPIPGDIIYCAVWHPVWNRLYGGTVGRGPMANGSGRIWCYDPVADEFSDLGPAFDGERLWSLAALPDGRLACGVAPHARLVVFDPRIGEKRDVWPDDLPAQQWLYDMEVGGDGLLYVTCVPGPELVVFNAHTMDYVGRLAAPVATGLDWNMHFLASSQGRVYGVLKPAGELVQLDWEQGMRKIADIGPQKMCDFTCTPDGRCVFLDHHEPVYRVADPKSGETWTRRAEFEGKGATALMGVWRGPDDRFYLAAGGMQLLIRTSGEPGDFERLGQASDGGGQPQCMLAHDGRLWLFSYTWAWVSIYDPAQPWNAGRERGCNPWQCCKLGQDQNRPHQAYLGPDGLIYVTSTSAYGLRGGALSRIDPGTLEVQVERLDDQTPWALAADAQYVYCGTAMRDESDLAPLASEAKILVWDPGESAFVAEYTPVAGATHYEFLHLGGPNNRILFGSTPAGTLFGYDLDMGTVDYLDATLERDGSRIGSLLPGPGSTFYLTSGGRLLLWDYGRGRLEVLVSTDQAWLHGLVQAADGTLLATAGPQLLRFR